MKDLSNRFSPPTSMDLFSAISSPALESGRSPLDGPDGQTIAPSGPDPAPAPRSRSRGNKKGLETLGTFGRSGFGSSASAGLTASLVSKLARRTRGSILYSLTWKATVTPSGRLIFRLRASAGRTSVSDFIGWPTATTPSGGQSERPGTTATGQRSDGSKGTVTLKHVASLAGWPTTQEGDSSNTRNATAGRSESAKAYHSGTTLPDAAIFSGWPAARATDGDKNVRTLEGALRETIRKGSPQDMTAAPQLSGWGTPASIDRPRTPETMEKCAAFRKRNANQNSVPLYIGDQAQLAGWGTANASTPGGTPEQALLPKQGLKCGQSVTTMDHQAALAGWTTTSVSDGTGAKRADNKQGGDSLRTQAVITGWARPASGDHRTPTMDSYADRGGSSKGERLCNQVIHQGPGLTGSSAEMASGARLNPQHPRWLMRLPPVWCACAVMAMRSMPKRRRSSSRPT